MVHSWGGVGEPAVDQPRGSSPGMRLGIRCVEDVDDFDPRRLEMVGN
jgi:hypothetical protein